MSDAPRQLLAGLMAKSRSKLAVAFRLHASGDHEDAVSRAYYAAFHAAQAMLLSTGERADTHRGVLTLFGMKFVKTGMVDRRFGRMLADLKENRNSSDYEAFFLADEATSATAIKNAADFLDMAERHLAASI